MFLHDYKIGKNQRANDFINNTKHTFYGGTEFFLKKGPTSLWFLVFKISNRTEHEANQKILDATTFKRGRILGNARILNTCLGLLLHYSLNYYFSKFQS